MTHVSPLHDRDRDAPAEGLRSEHADQRSTGESTDEQVLDGQHHLDTDGKEHHGAADRPEDAGSSPADGERTGRPDDALDFDQAPADDTSGDHGAQDDLTAGHVPQQDGSSAQDASGGQVSTDRQADPADDRDLGAGRHTGGQHAADESPDTTASEGLLDDGTQPGEHTHGGRLDADRTDDPAAAELHEDGEATATGVAAVPEATTQSAAAGADAGGRAETEPAGTAPGGAAGAQELWPSERRADTDRQWRDAQVSFVDDPAAAVSAGRELVTSALRAVTEALSGSDEHSGDTEQLRQQMRRYRRVLDALGSL